MASVCGASLALMDAGVPLKRPTAGIAMGLILEGSRFAVLSDILGDEDHLGDMDFKVAGTDHGITSLQMDIKIAGITEEIMKVALGQAKEGRIHILGEMSKALTAARAELGEYAPRIEAFKIPTDKSREVIGTGGKVIREIVEKTGAKVNIDDDGTVKVASADGESIKAAIKWIKSIASDPELGQIYEGTVVKVMEFGAFVNFFGAKDGLVHISQLASNRVQKTSDVVKEGDKVKVKLLGFDDRGKTRLSMKAVDQVTGEDLEAKQKSDMPAPREAAGEESLQASKITKGGFSAALFVWLFAIAVSALLVCGRRRRQALLHHLTQRRKIRLARRGAAERKSDAAAGLRIFQAQEFHPLVAPLDVGGDLRNQRDAVAACDHLNHRVQAAGAEHGPHATAGRAGCRSGRAKRQCLVAQAMTVLEQDQPALIDVFGGYPRVHLARIVRGHCQQKQVLEQPNRIDVGLGHRQRQHRDVQRTALDILDQLPGLGFPQLQPQFREPALQQRKNPRQQVRRQRRNCTERQPARQQPGAMAGKIDQIARGREHLFAAAGDFAPDIGQHHLARPPLDHRDAECLLEVANLHRQRGLGHGAGLGGAAEMAVFGERREITKLSKRDHSDKIN